MPNLQFWIERHCSWCNTGFSRFICDLMVLIPFGLFIVLLAVLGFNGVEMIFK